jgi:hypothetical protein
MHDYNELNQYTGLFSYLCFIALLGCFSALGWVGTMVGRFHEDYRKVNSLDEIERTEWRE